MSTSTGRKWLSPGSIIAIGVGFGVGVIFLSIAIAVVSSLNVSFPDISWLYTEPADGGVTILTVLGNMWQRFLQVSADNPLIFVLVAMVIVAYVASKNARLAVGTVATYIFCAVLILVFLEAMGWINVFKSGNEKVGAETATQATIVRPTVYTEAQCDGATFVVRSAGISCRKANSKVCVYASEYPNKLQGTSTPWLTTFLPQSGHDKVASKFWYGPCPD